MYWTVRLHLYNFCSEKKEDINVLYQEDSVLYLRPMLTGAFGVIDKFPPVYGYPARAFFMGFWPTTLTRGFLNV